MYKIKNLVLLILLFTIICFSGAAELFSAAERNEQPVAAVMTGSSGIYFSPKVSYGQILLTVSAPDGTIYRKKFDSGGTPYLGLSEVCKNQIVDGHYTYELRVNPLEDARFRDENADRQLKAEKPRVALTQSGHFLVRGNSIVTSKGMPEQGQGIARPDYTYNEDLYVAGSLCVGTDCASPETWGYDVVRLKENNLSINFDDTSSTSSFPANDWRIVVNDTEDGGANYFAVEDSTSGDVPFKIEAGAPSNSLYVEDLGRVGLNTSTPATDLHIVDADSPAVRLEQDTTSGFTAQAWEVAGNEANFFVRDVTNSTLPFKIQPAAPSDAFCIKADGKVGVGTWTPSFPMELNTTGINSSFVVKRTDGATNFVSATSTYAQFGAVSNHAVRILVNSAWKLSLNLDGSLGMSNGATCTAGGVWTNASSRALKENIENLSVDEAIATLTDLNPVKFNYKADNEEQYIGFIAEDAPELVATKDKKGMSPMDIVAVLTKVVQEQQKTITQLQEKIVQLEKNK
ncbi:MAG TPA: tail fiber domain-containing protein [Candidatus Deferrimicrobium sp.]|nr:tail fiber domain-containing protein [Candidatus Deferrimicrobium sp.]